MSNGRKGDEIGMDRVQEEQNATSWSSIFPITADLDDGGLYGLFHCYILLCSLL
jgi:hypothetical protein